MLRRFSIATLLSAPACAAVALFPAQALAQSAVAITNVTVIAMTDSTGAAMPGRTVIVRNGRIAEIGSTNAVRVPRDARSVDGTGRFLIPGLFDMHVHTSKTRG